MRSVVALLVLLACSLQAKVLDKELDYSNVGLFEPKFYNFNLEYLRLKKLPTKVDYIENGNCYFDEGEEYCDDVTNTLESQEVLQVVFSYLDSVSEQEQKMYGNDGMTGRINHRSYFNFRVSDFSEAFIEQVRNLNKFTLNPFKAASRRKQLMTLVRNTFNLNVEAAMQATLVVDEENSTFCGESVVADGYPVICDEENIVYKTGEPRAMKKVTITKK